MLTPVVPLEAAAPLRDAALAAVATALVHPENVYLLRVVEAVPVFPKAKIPTVEFPAADPQRDAELAAVADALVQPEYVYLLRVVELLKQQPEPAYPRAKIPTVALPVADP